MNNSVLVCGTGSLQAAIELANKGFKAYLVERSIGRLREQLDKVLPTNDCAACKYLPNIIAGCGNENIRILSNSEVTELKHYMGGFKVTGKCPIVHNGKLTDDTGLCKLTIQEIPNLYFIDRKAMPPCKAACPAGVNAQGYVALISQGKLKEALSVIRQNNPLSAICGRVCTHPCEAECNRGEIDEPIAIAALKRFVTDFEWSIAAEEIAPVPRTKDEKVAVIGSGPAGLTAAHDLVKMGYGVTIFEALPTSGGALSVWIPEYRLPKKIVQSEIKAIQKLGVEIKLNSPIGRNGLTVDKLWEQGYKAIFIAVGAHNNVKLNIPGEELEGVSPGVSFLKDVNLGKDVKLGEKVAVVGGGNVAIDAARTALRLGAKEVFIVYRRSRQEMPAIEEEVEEAECEGIEIHYLAAPLKILGRNGKVTGVECIRMELGEPDASGRRQPIPIKGSEFSIDADMVIPAIGEAPDLTFLPEDSKFNIADRGTLEVDLFSLATSQPGIFAGGDAVTGPATIIEAIAAGRKAALSIDAYLQRKGLPSENEPLPTVTIEEIDLTNVERKNRMAMPATPLEERTSGFKEVKLGLSQEMASEEADRCIDCNRTLSPQQCYVVCCDIK